MKFANILKRGKGSAAAEATRPGPPRLEVFARGTDGAVSFVHEGRAAGSIVALADRGSDLSSDGHRCGAVSTARVPLALPAPTVSSPTRPGLAFRRQTVLRGGGVRERMFRALQAGATIPAAAVQAGIPVVLAEVVVDEMRRTGLLSEASSFCSSGLGACEGGKGVEAQIHCAACPLVGLKKAG